MTHYKNMFLFYFSGTGNARQIAAWFAEFAERGGVNCRLIDMAKTDPASVTLPRAKLEQQVLQKQDFSIKNPADGIAGIGGAAETGKAGETVAIDEMGITLPQTLPETLPETLIAFVAPIHAFNYPKVALDFIRHFPKCRNRPVHVVLMAARGGMRIGKLYTPGLTGAAFMFSSWVLRQKGYTVMGQIPFDMPANCLALYPAQKPMAIAHLKIKTYKQVKRYSLKILAGEACFPSYKDIIQDVLLSPLALAYYLGGRFSFAKSFYASACAPAACTHCGLCQKFCPFQAIINKNKRRYWTLKCQSCMRCMNSCPAGAHGAIESAHGLLVATALVTALISSLLSYGLMKILPGLFVPGWLLGIILFLGLFVPAQIGLYEVQHKLLKYPKANKLISKLSLTRYQFWGRYKFKP